MADPNRRIFGERVILRSTGEADMADLLRLWNDGEVMRWVGFPEGLGYDEARFRGWLAWIRGNPAAFHFTVHAPGVGFCGEAFCRIERTRRRASLDIKFVPAARGGGRARDALATLIRWVFATRPEADVVWTQPSASNLAARTLYYSCGMRPAERPPDLPVGESFWVLSRKGFRDRMGERSESMSTTQDNLKEAFAGESQANQKYRAFANRAEQEGFPNIARLFRTTAEAERVHAEGHLGAMTGIGPTADNLRAAIAGETYEYTEMYPPMLAAAEAEGHKAKRMFGYAVKVEEIHAKLYRLALESIRRGEDLAETSFHLCPVCGHIEIGAAPASCPICGTKGAKFVQV